ncbi:MAG: type II toxin-antitoxin system prevent-host-death family antitoxin [Acidobacteria bacterium]|nr:MAG: type II toxin-antitoxin system prevent-host-death family antitoxin [Acidobacteriota bacterium]
MVVDHGTIARMKEIPISKFKATCLAVLENVRKTRRPVRVTRFGKPVAEVIPPAPQAQKQILGFMAGRGKIHGDIVHATPWLEADRNRRK